MGRTLIEEWRSYLLKRGVSYVRECAADIGMNYADFEPLFRPDYKVNSSDYFTFYDLRFAGKPVQAYWYLQNLMSDAEPSFGYYALAVLLEYTKNKLVITTNFDSLVEETLSLYHAKRPLVLGHESLAMFMDSTENTGRSMIAKVHRDLLLQPKNSESELQKLAESWTEPLRNAFATYTPIVIGYAGGDQTLMSFMERQQIGTVFWCTLGKNESDEDERIVQFLRNQEHGYLVNIRGFDEIMYELLDVLLNNGEYDKPDDRIRNYASQRAESYVNQLNRIVDSYATSGPTKSDSYKRTAKGTEDGASGNDTDESPGTDASVETTSKSSLGTLERLLTSEAETESNGEKATESATLTWIKGVRALVENRLGDALDQFTEAVRLEPGNARFHDSRGVTLHAMGRYEEALAESDEAVRLEPENAEYHRSRGVTLRAMGRLEESLEEIDRAIELAPNVAISHGSRALTLREMGREEEAEAEEEIERSLSQD
jgi:tetratricopeptide (TPR) repeat protein